MQELIFRALYGAGTKGMVFWAPVIDSLALVPPSVSNVKTLSRTYRAFSLQLQLVQRGGFR